MGAEPCGYTVPPVDVFSCGVCFFLLAAGIPPWEQARPSDPHFEFVQSEGVAALLESYGKSMHPAMEDLLVGTLHPNPALRFTLAGCLAHFAFCLPKEL